MKRFLFTVAVATTTMVFGLNINAQNKVTRFVNANEKQSAITETNNVSRMINTTSGKHAEQETNVSSNPFIWEYKVNSGAKTEFYPEDRQNAIQKNQNSLMGKTSLEPRQLPFIEHFDTEEDFLENWTIIDADEDGLTWFHCANLDVDGKFGCIQVGTGFFGSNDDYLIFPPIVFPTTGTYHITFYYRTMKLPWGSCSLKLLYKEC